MPNRNDKATCAECGQPIAWWFHHGAFQWTTDQQYAAMTSYCYPFVDFKNRHRPLEHPFE